MRKLNTMIFVLVVFVFCVWIVQPQRQIGKNIHQKEYDEQFPERLKATFAYQAMKWYNDQRAYPAGSIPVDWKERALSHIKKNNFQKTVQAEASLAWEPVGPGNIGGRVRSIAIDPGNPGVMYAGSVSGGIFKTTNGGTSWFQTSDVAANLCISSIVIDPSNSNIIYAGTGEGYFNIDALRGAGVLKSTNAGASWTILNNFSSPDPAYSYYYITKLIIRPDNPGTLLAAMLGGIWRTTNGGTNWSKLTTNSRSRFCMDLVMDPSNNNIIYASFGLFSTDGVYKSTNGGTNWSRVSTSFPSTGFGRISLAISQSNPSVVFASLMDTANYYTHSIRYTTDGGTNWQTSVTPFDNEPLINGTHLGGQGWYNNVIAVHPTSATTVYAGGINVFKSTNSGTNWSRISNGYGSPFMHVDQHWIVFHPTTPNTMFFGNDGGVYKSTDGGFSFSSLNNQLAVTQFYSGAVHPTADVYYGGTQDNGTLKSASIPTWNQVLSGDGGATAVDFNLPTTIFTEYVYLRMFKSTNSGSSWSDAMTGIPTSSAGWTSDRCSFIAPFVMDPSNPQTLVGGTFRVFRTTNGGVQWNSISGDLTGSGNGTNQVGFPGATITALGIAKTATQTIYIGTSGYGTVTAKIQVTTNAMTWNDVTKPPLPDRQVNTIAIDPANAQHAFVGFSGYNVNTPSTPGHIFATTNTGATWTNVSGDLPDLPLNAIVLDPNNGNHLVVGTDLGVFESTNGGTNWTQNTSVPNVAVVDLDYRASDGKVFAATHGRGMFRTLGPLGVYREPVQELPKEFLLQQNYPNPFNPTTVIGYQVPTQSRVTLKVYDLAGREVARLVDGDFPAGSYRVTFDAGTVASGTYFYRLTSGKFIETKRMVVLK